MWLITQWIAILGTRFTEHMHVESVMSAFQSSVKREYRKQAGSVWSCVSLFVLGELTEGISARVLLSRSQRCGVDRFVAAHVEISITAAFQR